MRFFLGRPFPGPASQNLTQQPRKPAVAVCRIEWRNLPAHPPHSDADRRALATGLDPHRQQALVAKRIAPMPRAREAAPTSKRVTSQ